MKPLILNFAETPEFEEIDYSLIEYSREQNLSVIKGTKQPAITQVSMETETFTKTSGEPTDSDRDYVLKLRSLLDTRTRTMSDSEITDSDFDYRNICHMMDTTTHTRTVGEVSDSDK